MTYYLFTMFIYGIIADYDDYLDKLRHRPIGYFSLGEEKMYTGNIFTF